MLGSLALLALLQAPQLEPIVPLESTLSGRPPRSAVIAETLTVVAPRTIVADTPVVRRPRSIDYSDSYYTRLTIHRYGSYAMVPLFIAEYSLGQNLIQDASPPSWLKPAHVGVASGIGILFGVNTITGLWNLWDSREDPNGRSRRIVHSVLMLASDAGIAAAAALAPEREGGFTNAGTYQHRVNVHRGVAIGSFALSTVGGAMMWFWKQ
ncbi:MAG: hypothetical protein ACJ796_15600 [Gemmatimonadaceae bacterium]